MADGGCCKGLLLLLPTTFYCLYPSPMFILFFIVNSLAVAVMSVVAEQRWLFSFLFFFLSFSFFSALSLLCHSLSVSSSFFRYSPPPSVFVFASSFISHNAGAIIDNWEDGGSWRWLWWLWQEATMEKETERGAGTGNPDKR